MLVTSGGVMVTSCCSEDSGVWWAESNLKTSSSLAGIFMVLVVDFPAVIDASGDNGLDSLNNVLICMKAHTVLVLILHKLIFQL